MIIFLIMFYRPNPVRTKETYLKILSKKKFYSKLKKVPLWMEKQIEEDLSFVKKNKVIQAALKKTHSVMKRNFPEARSEFIRYRIVDNTLYQFFSKKEKVSKKEGVFEKALKTLLRLKKLPDMDFIFSNIDGLPSVKNLDGCLFYYENRRDFYLVKNKDLQAAIFTRARSKDVKEGILLPDYFVLSELWPRMQKEILYLNSQSLWKQKKELLFWRGASSKTLRFKLCEMSLKHENLIDAGFSEMVDERKIKELKSWNRFDDYLSFQRPFATLQKQLSYKYLPVLDGVMCTYPGYQWRLLSNSIVFKQKSDEVQWFYLALKPYEHYIPIKEDMSDLIDKINWAKSNDEKCKDITKKATEFVLTDLMIEDGYVYLFKVLQNYAKYQNFDKNQLKPDLIKDKRWVSISNRKKANKFLKKQNYEFF